MNKKEELLLEKAQNGDAQAMLDLGRYYYFPKLDYEKSLIWLQKALDNGCYEAYFDIARVCEQIDASRVGRFDQNSGTISYELSTETIEWYLKALEYFENNYKDNVCYAYYAAELLSGENAIRIDNEKAFKYYLVAANMDNDNEYFVRSACSKVAQMYEEGLGCDVDNEKAKYYREKINQNK